MSNQRVPNNLPVQCRVITGHDAEGQSVFDDSVPKETVFEALSSDLDVSLTYMTTAAPENLNDENDISRYIAQQNDKHPSLTIPGGLILRTCNFAPGTTTAMHRTISIDFGIVVAGEVELILDSGETRLLKGELSVARLPLQCLC